MTNNKARLLFFLILAALLAVFAGCKSESPTAPPAVGSGGTGGSGNPPAGGVPPVTGANVTLTVSNANPLIDSTSTITANVTQNGAAVPNGTAVEFITSLGTFTDTQDVRTLRTTTGGVATATVTSPDAGQAVISATVNNITKTVAVTFTEPQVVPVPPSTAPTIASVTPNTGPPAGGTQVAIAGTNFRAPVRVLFDAGPAGQKEAFVVSVSPTQIVAITPPINLVSTQTQAAAVTVIVDAGSPNEQRVSRSAAFTYITTNLTPVVRTISPTSGPIEGGTRVTIIGDAFEQPVQVFFGSAQAQVITVNFNQIIVISPAGRDTASNGSGAVTGPVDVKVLNVNSGKSVISPTQFRYAPHVQVTLLGPNEGPFTGGTRFQMDGTGFNDPVSVTLAGVAAQIISVSGTRIIGISNGVTVTGCADVRGPTVVTNGDNGDFGTGPDWIYRVPKPAILSVTPNPATLGGSASVTVANAVDPSRITIGANKTVAPINSKVVNPDGTVTYGITVPSTLTLATIACSGVTGAAASIPTSFDVSYTSLLSTCTDTATGAITVAPAPGPLLTLVPTGFGIFTATITPATIGPPATPATVAPSSPQTVSIVNTGNTTPLTISSVTTSGACSHFTIVLPSTPQSLNQCDTAPIIARYNGQTSPASETCQVTIATNAGTRILNLTGVSQ